VVTLSRTGRNVTQEQRLVIGPEVAVEDYLVAPMDGVDTYHLTRRLTIVTAGWTDEAPPPVSPRCDGRYIDRDCYR
jgi:hypothetical protein